MPTIPSGAIATQATKAPRVLLDEYLQYFQTKKDVRPFLYRPKNSHILMEMDLKDPKTGRTLLPRDPVSTLRQNTLRKYIDSIPPHSKDLLQWYHRWTSITPRKKVIWRYMSAANLQFILYSSFFKIGSFSHTIGLVYCTQPKYIAAQRADVYDLEHFFNMVAVGNIHRNKVMEFTDQQMGIHKLKKAWSLVLNKEQHTGLTPILCSIWAKQFNTSVEELNLEGYKGMPTINLESEKRQCAHKDTAKVIEHEPLYVTARTILEFEPDVARPEIQEYVDIYKTALPFTNRPDPYDDAVGKLKDLLTPQKAPIAE